MTNFEKWDQEFRRQNLYAFNGSDNALLWLKVRAICRAKQLEQFLQQNNLAISSKTISEQNAELFGILENNPHAMKMLDSFLRVKNNDWYEAMGVDENQLKEDLYKVQQYTLGGDQNNSLDKYFISRYVKTISHYDELSERKNEIALNAWNYVQASWYNNWTSYLIESIFKRHPKVISAIGEIKSVDFFIGNMPIDLKVTFFPSQYLDEKLKEKYGQREMTWMKKKAKENNITFDSSLSDSELFYVLTEKFQERNIVSVLEEQTTNRRAIVREAQRNPQELVKWLYENQGEMRFGAENRLFVFLADLKDMTQSWKMKRAFSLIEPVINHYLDCFQKKTLKLIDFTFKKEKFKSLADVIFVVKD